MIKRQELAGPSCLTDAADDEPLFVLRANDELAPEIVERWAVAYRQRKINEGAYGNAQQNKFQDALQLAQEMREWKMCRVVPGRLGHAEWCVHHKDPTLSMCNCGAAL